jgi:myo-inositol-1-phosphate synthase
MNGGTRGLRMEKIRIAIVGLGNCASSLIQGIEYYRGKNQSDATGFMHWEIGNYRPGDIDVVAAFDIDGRKVGKDLSEAIFQPPNCTKPICGKMPTKGVRVRMGQVLDGFADHMKHYETRYTFVLSDEREPIEDEVIETLRSSGAQMLLNYLPVGSEKATRFYVGCALKANLGVINNIPVFIASDPEWQRRFERRGLPLIGDDVKSQIGATIIHRVLANLFRNRGVKLERTYQLNTGGNTDFLNMLDRSRLVNKKRSKTESVQSQLGEKRLDPENIHIGPSDWVAWQKDNKVAYIRMEGKLFGDMPMNLDLRLSVEDSPNSGGVVIDAVRCCKLALERGKGGILSSASAYFMKHPPRQFTDDEAWKMTEDFINGLRDD